MDAEGQTTRQRARTALADGPEGTELPHSAVLSLVSPLECGGTCALTAKTLPSQIGVYPDIPEYQRYK